MKSLKIFMLLVLLTAGVSNAQTFTTVPTPENAQNTLDLAGMTFTMPKDAVAVPVVKNVQMHYEYAVTFKDQPFEVRYAIAPMGYSVAEAYNGGKGVTPRKTEAKDNDMLAKVFAMNIAMNVAGGVDSPDKSWQDFPPEAVKREFGADWGNTRLIEIKNNSFGTEYKHCVMVTLHKNDVASAYIFYLSDTKENLMRLMNELIAKTGAFYALKFK